MSGRERYARLEALFAEIVELPPEAREARLAHLAPAEEELRAELLEMLRADESGAGFLEPPERAEVEAKAPRSATERAPEGEELAADTRLGAYRIAKKLADGGMGSVYLASRADREFEQLVAIKVLRRGLVSEAARARLRLERQTLASLSHPYIARLLDGGSTNEGHPYLVLEYIEGRPIDLWCEERRLDTAARIELLLRVCEAVAHAHRRLVVHRDLKPSNILVAEDGSPRLLDFGIAKILSMSEAGSDPSLHAFTPAYASPEQERGESVGTATDIYSLGRILEDLLLPTSRGLRHREVLAIVARATAEVEEERYSSVESLREELVRLLGGFPVQALAGQRSYVLRRFVVRQRIAVALLGLAFAMLLGAALALAATSRNALRDRERAEAALAVAESARTEALGAAQKARASETEARRAAQRHQVAQDFLRRLFRSPSARERGPDVRLTEFLDDAREQLELFPPADPLSEIAVRRSLGGAYAELARYDDAVRQLERGVELLRRELGEEDPQRWIALAELGGVLCFTTGAARGRELLERAAAEMRRRPEHFPPEELLATLHALMRSFHQERQWAAGIAVAEEAIDLIHSARIPAPQASDVLVAASSLELNRDESSERGLAWLREGIALAEERFGAEHFLTQDYRLGLAYHLEGRGEYEAALRLLEPLVASRRARFPRNHPNLRLPLTHLGVTLRELGRHDEAIRILREALLIQLEYGGEDHRDTGLFRNNLAVSLRRAGQVEEAEQQLRAVVAGEERKFGRSSVEWALARNNLAVLLDAKSEHREAQELLRSSIEILRAVDGEQSLRLARLWMSLGMTHQKLEEYDEAERCLARATEIRRALLPAEHGWIVEALRERGQVAAQRGDREAAHRFLREALDLVRRAEPPRFDQHLLCALDLATICAATQRLEEQREILEELWARSGAQGARREDRAEILRSLIESAARRGEGAELERWRAELRALEAGREGGG